MFSPCHLKALRPLQVFSVKSSSSPCSTIRSMKLKSHIHTLIISHMYRIVRALSKVKAVIIEIFKDNPPIFLHFTLRPSSRANKHYSKRKKNIMGSFRLHYNWCSSKSSHVLPVPAHVYNDSSEQQQGEDYCPDSQLSGYLSWLEEKGDEKEMEINEIDMLAEVFIAKGYEMFRLEKQESDRKFQEMLARSV